MATHLNLNLILDRLQGPSTPKLGVGIRTASKLLEVSESTIKRMLRSGELDSSLIRGRRVIPVESLRRLV